MHVRTLLYHNCDKNTAINTAMAYSIVGYTQFTWPR